LALKVYSQHHAVVTSKSGIALKVEGGMKEKGLVYWFQDLCKDYNEIVGKKCANLGEMFQIGLRIPPGFALSIELYRKFIRDTGLDKGLERYIKGLGNLNGAGIKIFEEISRKLRTMVEQKEMPATVREVIINSYHKLSQTHGKKNMPVSVRSSGTESRPGMFETYLNVTGENELIATVKKVWSSSYTPRALAFKVNKRLPIMADELGVAIVKLVNARSSGICFTIDPVTGDNSKIIIEANWGLGEGVVSGSESIDAFIVDKNELKIIGSHVGKKSKCVVQVDNSARWVNVPSNMQNIACLAMEEVVEIAKTAKSTEEKLGCPQDMEWAFEEGVAFPDNLFWLQTRPAKSAYSKAHTASSAEVADRITSTFREIDVSKIKGRLKAIKFKF